jgi:hypothetical protein
MYKIELPEDQQLTDLTANEFEPETLVERAKVWAMALWKRAEDLHGSGRDNAMHTAARWAGVSPSLLWRLRYRPPAGIDASPYFKLMAAHERLIISVEAKSAENLIALRALPSSPSRDRLVAELEEFLGIAARQEARPASEPAD